MKEGNNVERESKNARDYTVCDNRKLLSHEVGKGEYGPTIGVEFKQWGSAPESEFNVKVVMGTSGAWLAEFVEVSGGGDEEKQWSEKEGDPGSYFDAPKWVQEARNGALISLVEKFLSKDIEKAS